MFCFFTFSTPNFCIYLVEIKNVCWSARKCHIHSFRTPKHRSPHHHPQHPRPLLKAYTRVELPLLLPERNEGLCSVETPKGSCGVAIIPQQTRRGRQLTPKETKTPSTVITLAVISTEPERRSTSDLKRRSVAIHHIYFINPLLFFFFFSTNRRHGDARLAVGKYADIQLTVTLSYTNS